MPVYTERFETEQNGLGTLDRGNLSEAMTETLIWLHYVHRLEPYDESGAFLIPADLKAVDEAYSVPGDDTVRRLLLLDTRKS